MTLTTAQQVRCHRLEARRAPPLTANGCALYYNKGPRRRIALRRPHHLEHDPGRGGAVVVLRGRESRSHGEGRQQDRGMQCRSGGRV